MKNRSGTSADGHGQIAVPPISAAESALNGSCSAAEPITFRLPRAGTADPYFGACRSFWNERCLSSQAGGGEPAVQSIVVRRQGARRGFRFILYRSARAFFERLAREQSAQAPTGKEAV